MDPNLRFIILFLQVFAASTFIFGLGRGIYEHIQPEHMFDKALLVFYSIAMIFNFCADAYKNNESQDNA